MHKEAYLGKWVGGGGNGKQASAQDRITGQTRRACGGRTDRGRSELQDEGGVGRAHWLRAEGRVSDRSMSNNGRTTEGEATRGTSSGTARINTHTTRKYEEPTRTDASNATEEYTRSDTVQNIHYGGNYRSPESLPSASSPIALSCPRRRRCSASCMSLRWLSTTSSRPRKATAS